MVKLLTGLTILSAFTSGALGAAVSKASSEHKPIQAFFPLTELSSLPITGDNLEFLPASKLRASYAQHAGDDGGYHYVDINMDTTAPSINLDQLDAVTAVECAADGSMTLTFRDAVHAESVAKWGNQTVVLVSHRWDCGNNKVNPFRMVTASLGANKAKNQVTLKAHECAAKDWVGDFSIDVKWAPKGGKNSTPKKPSVKKPRSIVDSTLSFLGIAKRDTNDKSSNPIPLDLNFDSASGKAKLSDISLLKAGDVNNQAIKCSNCFIKGSATISMHVEGNNALQKISSAQISIDGNILVNIDMDVSSTAGISTPPAQVQIAELALSPLSVPGVFNLGPALVLNAQASAQTTVTGDVLIGGQLSLPAFHASASLHDLGKTTSSSGMNSPQFTAHPPSTGVTAAASVIGSLVPELAFDVDVFNGVLKVSAGIAVTGSLTGTVSVGTRNNCATPTTPALSSSLGGGVSFQVSHTGASPKIVNLAAFGSKDLGSVCVAK